MLRNLSISSKTGLGFGLILLVMAPMVAYSIRGLKSASDGFATYRRLAKSSVLSGRVQANMLIASRAAKDFLRSRDDEQLKTYDMRFATAKQFAMEQQSTLVDPKRRILSEKLVNLLDDYEVANQKVFQLTRTRDEILQDSLNPQGSRMRKNLSEVMDSAYADKDPEAAYLAGQSLEHVILGRLYLFKFLDENDDADVDRVRAELGSDFVADFDKTVAAIENPRRRQLLQDFTEARESYLTAFDQMVTTIQSRNKLTTETVLPLDQSIADISEEIKLSLKDDQDELGPRVQSHNTAMVRTVLVGAFAAVGLALVIAILFVRTINAEMSNRRASEERFDLMVRGSGDGLWDHDPATGEMWFADRFREILGYENEEDYPNVTESWSDGLHPDDHQPTVDAFAAHLERDAPYDVEYRLQTKQGPYRWIRARSISLRDASGKSYRAAGSISDITHLKQAEQELSEAKDKAERFASELQSSMERFRVLFEESNDAQLIFTRDGTIDCNDAAVRMVRGKEKADLLGKHPGSFSAEFQPDGRRSDERVAEIDAAVVEHGSMRFDWLARRLDGEEFPIETNVTAVTLGGKPAMLVGWHDLTDRKRAEQELVEARAAAEAANQAKSDFLANMSHEIRTPMNGIMGMTELALGTDLDREQREFLTTIESSADSLLSLINDILDFSKIEAKKLDLDPVNFELRERIGETLSTLAVRAHNKGLELAFDVDPDVPECIVGDVHRIRQILVNLIGNAIKFTEQGEIVLRIESVRSSEHEVTLKFSVKDTGIGLPKEKLDSIFQPFEQADVSTTRKYGGTGLGLAICVRLVELMGGEMGVESQLGKGTTFSFTSCLQVGEHAPTKQRTSPPKQLSGLRVLVVDDNATNRRILAKMLENWGMVPVVVDSAEKGLQALQTSLTKEPIGLVLSDVNMPEVDGFMFAKQLKNDPSLQNTPIIMLTSANRSGDSALCRQLGIAAHLIKPARQSFLFDAIATSVGIDESGKKRSSQSDKEGDGEAERKPLRLLLAEDNAVNQKFAVRALTKAGHTVTVANNGQEAVDRWSAESFDAVLMDIQMPVLDGYSATAEIRRRESDTRGHTPIIAMTAHAMKGDKEKCLEAGMDGYVTKPIKSGVMLAEIARVMSEFPPRGELEPSPDPLDDRRVG